MKNIVDKYLLTRKVNTRREQEFYAVVQAKFE